MNVMLHMVLSDNWKGLIEHSVNTRKRLFIANLHVNWITAIIFLVDGFKIIF